MSGILLVVALGLIVVAAVAYPLLAGVPRYDDAAALDADLATYRAALEAGTICPRCRFPNRPGSRFCTDCGAALAAGD